ncbi:putative cation efflux family protein family [Diplodia seriata]|uniref:Zinc transporter n=1 Tax=Diplodia seriata TaxID=420778 RepID=A0A0G2GCA6_9PEZI|nr:putative cation efflux family protein family [Diplodia seriata]OMP81816.1 putative zinc transporter zrg17 [Diplodia seriata]
MASDMPIPVPPRTPTPPPEDQRRPVGLGLPDDQLERDALSPMSATFPPQSFGALSPSSANLSPRTPNSAYYTPQMTVNSEVSTPVTASSETPRNPFNFQPQQYVVGKSPAKSSQDIGRRRGHKYKHSSVSHQIFLEPAPRAPLQVPASLPLPNWSEIRSSMTPEQKMRGLWCVCHLLVGGYVKYSAQGSTAMTALSHLMFYDFVGAAVCCIADIGSNFECWRRTSLKRPFGFERFEVLTGLAMAVILIFTGFDLVSHNLQHLLENSGGHESHHPHVHERVSAGSVDTAALAAIVATLISAIGLKNHARISKVLRFAYLDSLPSVLSNPSHFLTLSCSSLLLLLPLLSIEMYIWLDRSITAFIAMSMMLLGWRLGWSLGRILMMSYSGPGLESLLRVIEADPAVSSVEDAKVWQVHYGLCQANFKLRVRSLDDMAKLRDRIQSLVRNKLAGGYGRGGEKWEVSTQLTLDTD